MNFISLENGGIRVSPVGRQVSEAFYREVGPNLDQARNGATYEFYNEGQGLWRSGPNVWPHERCG